MLIDTNHELETALDVSTLSTGVNYTSNSIDLQVARDLATGTELFVVFNVTAAILTANTVWFGVAIGSGVDGSGVLNAGQVTTNRTNSIAQAGLIAGASYAIPLRSIIVSDASGSNVRATPAKNSAANLGERYMAGVINCNIGAPSAGTIDVFLATNVEDSKKYYPKSWYLN